MLEKETNLKEYTLKKEEKVAMLHVLIMYAMLNTYTLGIRNDSLNPVFKNSSFAE